MRPEQTLYLERADLIQVARREKPLKASPGSPHPPFKFSLGKGLKGSPAGPAMQCPVGKVSSALCHSHVESV